MIKKYISIFLCLILSACGIPQKLSQIGESPQLSVIKDPQEIPGYEPVSMPMPEPVYMHNDHSNSLWQNGSRAFFKDQRACKIGDVLTAEVDLDRKQAIEFTPNINRKSSITSNMAEVLGHRLPLQKKMAKALPGVQEKKPAIFDPYIDLASNPSHSGTAKYDVKDKMQFRIAVTIIQILPNGNMVIQGREEIKLVNEIREIEIKGVIRREDISSNNTIHSLKIANLRISYGGRGELSDSQEQPWGQQYLNAIMPF